VAVVSSLDLLAILSGHANMNGLRTDAITTFHHVETGAPAGIARIVQAVTAPNEGQRFLQGELRENTMQGESRERTSTTTDAAGNVFTERLAERSVLMEDGRSVNVQQQQVVAQVSDTNILLAAINKGQTDVRDLKDTVLYKLEQGLANESKARELAMQKEGEAREQAFLALELKNSALEKRMADLEQGGNSKNKKPRKSSKMVIKQKDNIVSWTSNGATLFGWNKTLQGETRKNKGFSSAEAAMLDMDRFYDAYRP